LSAGADQKPKKESERFDVYEIKRGTALSVELRTTIDSATSRVDDQVDAVLHEPIEQDGAELIPAGSPVHGTIVEVRAASGRERRGRLALAFHVIQHSRTHDRASITTKAIVADAPVNVKMSSGQVLTIVLARTLFVKIPSRTN